MIFVLVLMTIVIEFYLINLSYSYDYRIFIYMDIYLFLQILEVGYILFYVSKYIVHLIRFICILYK